MRYCYLAATAQGKKVRGDIEAETPRQARQLLRDKQLVPLTLTVASAPRFVSRKQGRKPLSCTERVLLMRQLATLIGAGLPLAQTLYALEAQSEKPPHKALLACLRQKVLEGCSLADSVSMWPKVFPLCIGR